MHLRYIYLSARVITNTIKIISYGSYIDVSLEIDADGRFPIKIDGERVYFNYLIVNFQFSCVTYPVPILWCFLISTNMLHYCMFPIYGLFYHDTNRYYLPIMSYSSVNYNSGLFMQTTITQLQQPFSLFFGVLIFPQFFILTF